MARKNAWRAPASSVAGALSRSVAPSRRITSVAPADSPSRIATDKRDLLWGRVLSGRCAFEHDLEGVGLGCRCERAVRRHRLVEREAVRRKRRRVQSALRDQLQEAWGRDGVDEA